MQTRAMQYGVPASCMHEIHPPDSMDHWQGPTTLMDAVVAAAAVVHDAGAWGCSAAAVSRPLSSRIPQQGSAIIGYF